MKTIGIIADTRLPADREYPGHGLGKCALNFVDDLTRKGYAVHLFSHPDSKHKYANLVGCDTEKEMYEKAVKAELDVYLDISHQHSFQNLSDKPVVNLSVDREGDPGINPVFQSKAHRNFWGKHMAPIVRNALDTQDYEFVSKPEDYYLFMAPMYPQKGYKTALYAAFITQVPLVMAGPNTERLVTGLGAISGERKMEILSNAKALLFPSSHEAGTLTPLEANACGVPVLCYDYGAAGEYISHGKTGYCAKTQEDFIEYVIHIDSIDRAYCRQYIKENFSLKRSGKQMEDLLEKAFEGELWTGKDYNGRT